MQPTATPSTYNNPAESFAGSGWLASFFFSYIIEKNRPTDPEVVARFKAAIKAAADKEIGYPQAEMPTRSARRPISAGGAATRPRVSTRIPACSSGRLTKEQKYIDAASQLMDYDQGLNPIGKCYMCGIGFNRVHNPHDRESAYTKKQGLGAAAGHSRLRTRRIGQGRIGSRSGHARPRAPVHR